MIDVGNIDITATKQSVELRMRHVVRGHPGAVLSFNEVRRLIGELQKLLPKAAAEDDEDLIG